MDNVRYLCFCASVFPNLNAFDSHLSYCQYLMNTSALNGKSEAEPFVVRDFPEMPSSPDPVQVQDPGPGPYFNLNLLKSWTAVVGADEDDTEAGSVVVAAGGGGPGSGPEKPEKMARNLWGRRLPKRTRVPYLSRAIPLSSDHSFESCQCGAVFVTRLGKRQHQARFCKIVKNKSKGRQNSVLGKGQSPVDPGQTAGSLVRSVTTPRTDATHPRDTYTRTRDTGNTECSMENDRNLLNYQIYYEIISK